MEHGLGGGLDPTDTLLMNPKNTGIDVLQNGGGIFAISALAVERDLAGRGGVGDDSAAGSVHRRQSSRRSRAVPGALERIVPAGVENDDLRY
jgi:hypothetical protein